MNSSPIELKTSKAKDVAVTQDALTVDLDDGRTISVPLAWYPRLLHGTSGERDHWRLIGSGEGIHWPDLDEDINIENLLATKRSAPRTAANSGRSTFTATLRLCFKSSAR